jgi:hypothetical protein
MEAMEVRDYLVSVNITNNQFQADKSNNNF